MKIKKFIGKDGRQWFWGSGTPEEVELLNVEKNFDVALDTLCSIKKTHDRFFDMNNPSGVDRSICGKRKAV